MEQSGKRLSGRRVTLGFGLLVLTLVSIVIGFWFFGRTPSGRIHAFAPVDARRVLLVREGYRQKHFAHLSYVDIERGPIWSAPFHGIPHGAPPVVAGDRAVVWIRHELGGLQIGGQVLESGEFAFRALDLRVPPGVRPEVAMVAVGPIVVAAYHLTDTHVVVVDARNGHVMADHPLLGTTHVPVLRANATAAVVFTRDGVERIVDLTTGGLRPVPPGVVTVPLEGRPSFPFTIRASESGRVVPMLIPSEKSSVVWVVAGRSVAAIEASDGRVIATSGPAEFVTAPRESH